MFGVRDLPSYAYYISMIIMAVSSGYVLSLFQKAMLYTEGLLIRKIKYLENNFKKAFSFIYEETDDKKWIRKEKIKEHAIRRLEVTDEIVLGYEEIR